MATTQTTPTSNLPEPPDPGVLDLIHAAQANDTKPVIEDLLNTNETAGLHGPPEVFKTIFCLQLAEALANGSPLLGVWQVPIPHTVYFFETEMSAVAMGKRLLKMYQGPDVPRDIRFASEARLLQFKRTPTIAGKFELLNRWITEAAAEVVIIDTCNPFFRGRESPSEETAAGEFFDRLAELSAPTKLFVRHNRKMRSDRNGDESPDDLECIRGSGQFGDVPDLALQITRKDKRTNEAKLSVTKYRHGPKPPDLTVWFDALDFRLISLPPVIQVLRSPEFATRESLLTHLQRRFSVSPRYGDAMILQVRDYLTDVQHGHAKGFRLDWEAIERLKPEWASRMVRSG
jgi:hypothetical protein